MISSCSTWIGHSMLASIRPDEATQRSASHQAAIDILQVKQFDGDNLIIQSLTACSPYLWRQSCTQQPKPQKPYCRCAREWTSESKSHSSADTPSTLLQELVAVSCSRKIAWSAAQFDKMSKCQEGEWPFPSPEHEIDLEVSMLPILVCDMALMTRSITTLRGVGTYFL